MLKIFIDFDGTITRKDVGDAMFETFGGERCRDIVQEYRDEKISAAECFRRECEACGIVDKEKLDSFLDNQEIDSTFAGFVNFCRERSLDMYIVSDGMNYYIDRILKKNGIHNVPYFSNRLELVPFKGSSRVRFKPTFPFRDEVCDRCACCKRNHMLTMSGDDDVIVYVGEGYSDRCPARYADIVFAKDDLLKFCRQENISYLEYRTFADVQLRLESILSRKQPDRIRKSRQAELARRAVFVGG